MSISSAHWQPLVRQRFLFMTAAAVLVAGCGGGDDSPPRLSAAAAGTLSGSCTDLTPRLSGLPSTSVTAVTLVPQGSLSIGGQPVREHCLVQATSYSRTSSVDGQKYAINWEMRLPLSWNGRFLHQGNGGTDGTVVAATGALAGGPVTHALFQGFAVLSSDAGHLSASGVSWGIDPQARLDYGYQAVGKLTPIAKAVIERAYLRAPDRSYFAGTSNGGRHAMIAAARYAADYDGILAGSPGYNLPIASLANMAGAKLYNSISSSPGAATPANLETALSVAERAAIANAVLARCDSLDGAKDGLVQNVSACRTAFDLNRDVPTCAAARTGACLTAAQKNVVAQVFGGPKTESGRLIYSGFPFDSGIAQSGNTGWEFSNSLSLDSGSAVFFNVPPISPAGFNGPAYALNQNLDASLDSLNAMNATYQESAMSFMTPPDPTNMNALRDRGGKIIVYHGVSDPIFSVDDSEKWYTGLTARRGGSAQDFARFFRVPGMGHSRGGPATDQFDMLSALVAWVEQGVAPDRVMATARGAGNPGGVNTELPADWAANRTRPLCPYPAVAMYDGAGSIESAESFTCRTP